LQSDTALAEAIPAAVQVLPQVMEILAKKSEGRPVTPEEYQTLVHFVDRVEKRTEERKQAEQAAEDERMAQARSSIPEIAFTLPLENLGLADHVYTILTEAELRMVGDLMLAMNLNPEKVHGISGIGPKAMESIKTALAEYKFPEPEPVALPEVTLPQAEEVAVEAVPSTAVVELAAGEEPVSAVPVAVEVVGAVEETKPIEEESIEGRPLEEIFTLRPDMLKPVAIPAEEEDESDKKKKKKKKHVQIEYDPDKDQTIARKKHKRGDEVAGEWEE
jgi:N utilization substance protein A